MMSVDLSSVTYSRQEPDFADDIDPVLPSRKLYGREEQQRLLLEAYQRVARSGNSEVVVLCGRSGSGKTSLVDTLREPVISSSGYFCSGKFFQNVGFQEAYSALMAAFSELCDLLAQSDDFEIRKPQIQEALGNDALLLSKAISGFGVIQDISEHLEEGCLNEVAYARFKVACKTFLHAMSSNDHPIVLFIDDVQWTDKGSSELLDLLVQDEGLNHILFIIAYRKENANASEIDALFSSLKNFERKFEIFLTNIDLHAIEEIVMAIIGSRSDQMKELSKLILEKSQGNPFHVLQFLEVIQSEGLLKQNSSGEWIYNVEEIRREIMISQALVDLLARKINRLPQEVQEILKVAALMGYRFDEGILCQTVSGLLEKRENGSANALTPFIAKRALAIACQDGFLDKLHQGYQFSHDKLQSAFCDMIHEEEAKEIHFELGLAYLAQDESESVYYAAVHLNAAPKFYQDNEKRIELAGYNLEASKLCRTRSAFIDSEYLLHAALNLLDVHEKWTTYFDLAFKITEDLALVQLISGNVDACRQTVRDLLNRAKSNSMKVKILLLNIEIAMAKHEVNESIEAAYFGVKTIGLASLPRKIKVRHVAIKILSVKKLLWRKSDDDILSLPMLRDMDMIATIKMLVDACWCGLAKDDEIPAVYAALLACELTLKNGLSKYSSGCINLFGIIELGLGRLDSAHRFGKLAMKMIDKVKCRETECDTIATCLTLLMHWKVPLGDLVQPLDRGLESAHAVGNYLIGSFCLANCFAIKSYTGMALPDMLAFLEINYGRICEMGTDPRTAWVQPPIQFVLNMMSPRDNWRELTTLTGSAMDEVEFLREARQGNHAVLISILCLLKFQLAYHFGFYSVGHLALQEMETVGKANRHHYNFLFWQFFGALTNYQLYRKTGYRKHSRAARKYKKSLQRIENRGCPNTAAPLSLLSAEEASIGKTQLDAVKLYLDSANIMKEAKMVPFEALAYERLAFYLLKHKRADEAKAYFDEALGLYRDEWGSDAKYEWLKEKSHDVLYSHKLAAGIVQDMVIEIPGQ